MTFVDARLPKKYGYGTVGGPKFFTEVVETSNKREFRNRVWRDARRRYDLSVSARTQAEAQELHNFHSAMGGRENSFRYWDPLDYQISDNTIGVGDGTTKAFQIIKTYTVGSASHDRTIDKIVADTLVVKVNDVILPDGSPSSYSVNLNTGIITFDAAPANGHVVQVTCEFDVCVRFVEDELRWTAIDSHGVPPDNYLWRPESLTLIEVIGE